MSERPVIRRVLAVTNMFRAPQDDAIETGVGAVIQQQVASLRQLGLDVALLHVDRVQLGMKAYVGLADRVRAKVGQFRPDVVHVMYGGVMADIVTRALRSFRALPTVVSYCGTDLLGEPPSAKWAQRVTSRYGVWASRRAARRAAGVVVKSRNLLQALPTAIPPERVRIIPNGIDLERFRPMAREACRAHLNWEPGCFHVLFPANAGDAVKRPALARAAVDALHRTGIRVVLHRLEHVRYADVPLWLNASDVVLLTSHHEGSPNIIKEALACNRPVVSVDVGDVRERIEGIAGCFLAGADPADLAAKLRRVHDGPRVVTARDQMSNLSLSSVGRQLKQFYETFHGPSLNPRRTRTAAGTSPSTLNGVVPIEN